jgi:hypothetical protein
MYEGGARNLQDIDGYSLSDTRTVVLVPTSLSQHAVNRQIRQSITTGARNLGVFVITDLSAHCRVRAPTDVNH